MKQKDYKEVRLTTEDNPYDPFDDWYNWNCFDLKEGYNTWARLASITNTSDQLSDEENKKIIEEAINSIIRLGAFSKEGKFIEYKLVYKY